MAGVIRFDREAALDRAVEAFWRKGYDATSVQDLKAATGLGRGSLYNAFGDKEALFGAALERYAATVGATTLRQLRNEDVKAGVQGMLEAIVARMTSGAAPPGCLIATACLGAGEGRPASDFVAAVVRGVAAALEAALARARDGGQIPSDADPQALARFYCAVAQGLGLMHKARADRETLQDVVAVAMRAWPG